jgi:phosphate transport system substrate-binding protein
MVNLAQAWSEAYQKSHPDVSAQVRGGGSGVGIAALINGKADIAPSSRAMEPDEIELAKKNTGKEPKQFIVGTDALAVYVHKDNPLDAISIEELAAVYGEGGKISKWQELGVENPACSGCEIVRVSRQNNSGTYVYFRDVVLGKDGNYKQGTTAQSGSSDVVALVSSTPCAIGYSGMGYNDPGKVKMLKISKKKGEPGVPPTLATALDGTYPIARPLYIYTLGEPTGPVQEFIQWMLGPEGQAIVEKVGYVPNANQAAAEAGSAEAQSQSTEAQSTEAKAEEPAKEEAKPAEESKPAEAAESPAAEAAPAEAAPTEPAPTEPAPTEPAPAADAAKPE